MGGGGDILKSKLVAQSLFWLLIISWWPKWDKNTDKSHAVLKASILFASNDIYQSDLSIATIKYLYQYGPILTDQALVVVGVDNAIHCLNLYLVDSMVIFLHTCPLK